jgi:hypothetical protein
MPFIRPIRLIRPISFFGPCLLALPLLTLAWRPSTPPPADAPPVTHPTRQRRPSEEARREGWRCCIQAQQAVVREAETLEAWDPEASRAKSWPDRRRELLAQDPGGFLQRGRAAAQRAAALARTPAEAFDAALLRARIECDLGNHAAELTQAQRLLARHPYDALALGILQRATTCIGRQAR